jgi:hypothetical protein
MAKYRTMPFVIEAENIDDPDAIEKFAGANVRYFEEDEKPDLDDPDAVAAVHDILHSTWVLVLPGQYIIKGMKGEFYPCDPEIFHSKYEPWEVGGAV